MALDPAVRSQLETVLAGLTPTLPIELADTAEVWKRVRPIVPSPFLLDVMHDYKGITVRVFDGVDCIFARVLSPAA